MNTYIHVDGPKSEVVVDKPGCSLLADTIITRRMMLKGIVLGGLSCLVPFSAGQTSEQLTSGTISLYNIHTDEESTIKYLRGNEFDPEALEEVDYFFRHPTGGIHPIDPRLVLLLDILQSILKARDRPFQLLSGYRPPTKKRFSYHHKGMAADVRIDDVPLRKLRNTALELGLGGVGIYPTWVHVDVGPCRKWGKC